MQSLRRLGIFERNKPSLVIKKIIMDILTGNPMLEYENAPTDTRKPVYIQITNYLFELGLLNPKKRCDRNQYRLIFDNRIKKFGVLRQRLYMKFFGKIKFRNNLVVKDNDERYLIVNSMKCSKCGIEHENFLRFKKFSKILNIEFY